VTELDAKFQEIQGAAGKSAAETARLEGENEPLRKEVQHLRSGIAALEASLAEERSRVEASEARSREKQAALDRAHAEIKTLEKAENEDRSRKQSLQEEATSLKKRLDEAESRGWDNQEALSRVKAEAEALRRSLDEERRKSAAAREDLAAVQKRADETKARETELQTRIADADRVEVERAHLEHELARVRSQLTGFDVIHKERDEAVDSLEKAISEVSTLRQEISRRDRDQEAQRDKIVVVTSDLEEIEKKYTDEQQELGGLREKSQALEEALASTQQVLAQTHGEMQSLQEILQREQEEARTIRNEATGAQARLQELTSSSARLEEQVKSLLDQNQRLKDRLNKADITAAATQALDHRLATVERLMDQARQQTGDARAAAGDSRAAADQFRKSMLLQGPAKRKQPGTRIQGGVALDGHALLQEFFRRIRLKERLQKHVPIQERDGQRHPSELLQDVVSALMAGDRRPDKDKGPKLEILGASRGPDISDLRQFLDRVPPRASHAVSRVHDALRHNLFSMPERPGRLVLDVGSVDLARSYRPLVAYEPESKEFWHGELRTVSDKDTQGIVPFLKECVSKVPGGFPRSRVRFRLDARYFSEDAIRFLNGRGCGYVMEAPDLKPIRDAAKKAKYRELSGGWEAGEFQQRIHPIRKTVGRFVVVRHRLSRKGRPERPMFRDQTWEYCVYVVDSKVSPWRAYQTYAARPAAQAESASMLSDFTKSKLLGRRRRSHGALFPLYLMASDLVQWFRRKALPMEERGRDLDSLRTELLKLPTTQERMGLPRLPVLSKKDKSRKSFERVARKIKRLRPVRPFKFRK
jgi:predicted  nucleic acid-binding Zn-ribbon protein